MRVAARAATLAIYAAFALALVLATEPIWRPLVFGYTPGFEDLLLIRCLGGL